MKATFALLTNHEIHNLVRKLSWEIHRKYRTGVDICRLPAHISLKQPFETMDLVGLEIYMENLVTNLAPFEVDLTGLELIETTIDDMKSGIIWLDVRETETLRDLHNKINRELTQRFGNVPAEFDGSEYHFHMSVAIGGQPWDVYQKIHNEFMGPLKDLHYMVREMALFVCDEQDETNAGYMTYKILPLIGK